MFGGGQVRPLMGVYDSNGGLVGTVERVEGGSIRLAEGGPVARPDNPYIHLHRVDTVSRSAVRLDLSGEAARRECQPRAIPRWAG